jgi:RimJ/RimL family protein N-acetyltransferase
MPSLVTARLLLDPTSAADLPELLDIWNEPGVNQHLFDAKRVTREDAERILQSIVSATAPGVGSWIIRLRSDSSVVGSAALMPVAYAAQVEPRLDGHIEPAIAIRQAFWKQVSAQKSSAPLSIMLLPLAKSLWQPRLIQRTKRLFGSFGALASRNCLAFKGLRVR